MLFPYLVWFGTHGFYGGLDNLWIIDLWTVLFEIGIAKDCTTEVIVTFDDVELCPGDGIDLMFREGFYDGHEPMMDGSFYSEDVYDLTIGSSLYRGIIIGC